MFHSYASLPEGRLDDGDEDKNDNDNENSPLFHYMMLGYLLDHTII